MSSRRDFLRFIAVGSTAVIGSKLLRTQTVFADEKQGAEKKLTKKDLVPESDTQAQALNYCENADKDAKAKAPKCPARKEASKKTQYCNSPCNFYTPVGKVGNEECGKCLLIPGEKYVAGKGWCNSWAPKA